MNNNKQQRPSFWQIVVSTLGAAFGVQNRKNQERDFTQGSIYTYITAGIIFTVLFVLTISLIVNIVLNNT